MKTPTETNQNLSPYNLSSISKSVKKIKQGDTIGRTDVPPRKRTSRACDQCNYLRTKCDGRHPCAQCNGTGLVCEYFRARKKRGRASRKPIAQQQINAVAATTNDDIEDDSLISSSYLASDIQQFSIENDNASGPRFVPPTSLFGTASDEAIPHVGHYRVDQTDGSLGGVEDEAKHQKNTIGNLNQALGSDEYVQNLSRQSIPSISKHSAVLHSNMTDIINASSDNIPSNINYDEPILPSWQNIASPITSFTTRSSSENQNTLRYPVLKPIHSDLKSIVPDSLAYDLLDFYFASTSSAHHHPRSPVLLAVMFRKNSFLHAESPRHCSPALLASILWVAAQNCDSPFLNSPPSARSRICQKLFDLTIGYLKPLIHGANGIPPDLVTTSVTDTVNFGGLGVFLNEDSGPSAIVDDVATYCHIATILSASEHKAASLRWWTAAWSLARELKLGQELPPNPGSCNGSSAESNRINLTNEGTGSTGPNHLLSSNTSNQRIIYSEEEREERRRIWWLLYTVDRHLSLCYNKPLFLLDSECVDLLQPVPEGQWQSAQYGTVDKWPIQGIPFRQGPSLLCTSHSIYGYFTPLMTILGEIIDLRQARNHPRFGNGFRAMANWKHQMDEIRQHLDIYQNSLEEFETQSQKVDDRPELGTPFTQSTSWNGFRDEGNTWQTKLVVAYGRHVLHVLHILLHDKWDPISLLDDEDLWISSAAFPQAMQHAIASADAITTILDQDPDLSYMPFFFGIYLLQGSFLLLLIADKLQAEANSEVVDACEIVVRAIEACVVTLNTEYQRNFRKVMRSVLSQAKGRFSDDLEEQEQRRREVLSLYRWTPNGAGLAI